MCSVDSMEERIKFIHAGKEGEFMIKKGGLLCDLKEKYEKHEGIEPEDQSWYCGFFPLESDDFPLNGNLPLSVVVPQAAEPMSSDLLFGAPPPPLAMTNETGREITIAFGRGSRDFETLVLTPGWSQNLTLTRGKLGIITRTTRDSNGMDVFMADRYRIPGEEFPVVLKAEGDSTVVFKITADGEEERLPIENSVEYRANTRLLTAANASKIFANVARGLKAAYDFFEGVAEDIADIV